MKPENVNRAAIVAVTVISNGPDESVFAIKRNRITE